MWGFISAIPLANRGNHVTNGMEPPACILGFSHWVRETVRFCLLFILLMKGGDKDFTWGLFVFLPFFNIYL